jgi:hypothetical protein
MGNVEKAHQPWSVRLSISLEAMKEEEENALPAPHPPMESIKCRREKKRRSYTLHCWRFDLTRVIDTSQIDADCEVFEIELELVDTTILFYYDLRFVIRWGLQLMQSILDILEKKK